MPYDAEAFVNVSGPDHRGRVRLQWQDMDIEVRVNWAAIQTMQDAWGTEGFIAEVSTAIDAAKMESLIRLTSMVCFHVETGERVTVDEAYEWTFPINYLREAIRTSWQYSWHGGAIVVEEEAGEEGSEKKLVSRIAALLKWPWARRSGRGSAS